VTEKRSNGALKPSNEIIRASDKRKVASPGIRHLLQRGKKTKKREGKKEGT